MRIKANYLDHNFSHRSGDGRIEWIVVHYAGIACAQGSAAVVARSLHNRSKTACERSLGRAASTHYVVGDDGIIQLVRDRHRAWHVGSYKTTNKCRAENNNSLGVDLVEHKRNPSSGSVNDNDWYFTASVMQTGAKLVAELAKKYGIKEDHIVRHFDVTGKLCPKPFVGTYTNDVTGAIADEEWRRFLMLVKLFMDSYGFAGSSPSLTMRLVAASGTFRLTP